MYYAGWRQEHGNRARFSAWLLDSYVYNHFCDFACWFVGVTSVIIHSCWFAGGVIFHTKWGAYVVGGIAFGSFVKFATLRAVWVFVVAVGAFVALILFAEELEHRRHDY